MRIPFGFKNVGGRIAADMEQAAVVKMIYDLYLGGRSLGGIADELRVQGICSPSGNQIWMRAAIDKVLVNSKYVPIIIPDDTYWQTQVERGRRSNIGDEGRKAARYSSQNVLSGLLVCGDCGRTYRRIARPNGEVVWRCADRVEKGKMASCRNPHTVSDEEIKRLICDELGMEQFDDAVVKASLASICVGEDGVEIQLQHPQNLPTLTV